MSRKIKKSVSILLALVMLCGVLGTAPFTVSAAVTEYTTSTGGVYTFNNETGELHLVSGSFTGSPWSVTKTDVLSVTANDGVIFTGSCESIFNGFKNCESIDLRNVATSNVTSTNRMFHDCMNLKTLLFPKSFNTNDVKDMSYMFWSCIELTSLDLSSFKISNSTGTTGVFGNCHTLKELTISDKFGSITSGMGLNNGRTNDSGWITSDSKDGTIVSGEGGGAVITDTKYLPGQGETKTYIWIASTANYELIPDEENTGMYTLHLISGFFRGTTWRGDFDKTEVKSVTANDGVKFTGSCNSMFSGFSNCESIDLRNVATSNVTSTNRMFMDCVELKTLLFSEKFKTETVQDMTWMFRNFRNLTLLDLSGFKISNTNYGDSFNTNTTGMFSISSALKELTISDKFGSITSGMGLNNGRTGDPGWIEKGDTTDGTIVSGTGNNAVITDPYLPEQGKTKTYVWISGEYEFIPETGKLHLISGFFRGTTWRGDFDKMEVKSVTANDGVVFTGNCNSMFSGFSNCESIDLRNVATSNVTSTNRMFMDCVELKTLLFSEKFKTETVQDMKWMFRNFRNLTLLDLSGFKISNTNYGDSFNTNTTGMFSISSALKELTISDKFGSITSEMTLNNGENNNGWRIKGEPSAANVSGYGENAGIAAPNLPGEGEIKTYKWIEYATVTWNNWDDSELDTEDYKLETTINPTYKGTTPTRPDSDGKTYTFVGWTDGETEYGLNDALPYVTQDITYTARYTVQTIKTYTLNYIYQGRSGGNKGAYVGDDGATDEKTYTATVELGDSDLKESGMPKDKVLVDNAPVVNDPYKNCRWTIDDEHVIFDPETKIVTITAEQPERKYSVVFKNSNNETTDVFRVKLNDFVKKNDSFITAEETDGSGTKFAYWSVVQNNKEVARCFERKFNLRVTGDSVVTANYGEATNLVTLSDAEISRQKFTENGTTKDLLYADFITAYMNKQGMELSTKGSSEYKTGVIVQYSPNVKVEKENAPGETLSENDKITFASGDELTAADAKTIANGGTVGGKYSYLNAPIDNTKYNDKNRLNKSLVFTNTENARRLVLCAYYYVYNAQTDEIEMTAPVYFYLYDAGNAVNTES